MNKVLMNILNIFISLLIKFGCSFFILFGSYRCFTRGCLMFGIDISWLGSMSLSWFTSFWMYFDLLIVITECVFILTLLPYALYNVSCDGQWPGVNKSVDGDVVKGKPYQDMPLACKSWFTCACRPLRTWQLNVWSDSINKCQASSFKVLSLFF